MFKKFTDKDARNSTRVKNSVWRGIRNKVIGAYPDLTEDELNIIFPKKTPMYLVKSAHKVQFAQVEDKLWFFSVHKDSWYPTLRTLHMYPHIMPRVQVDRGAIKHVLNGADIMAPGLTSAGGDCSADIEEGTVVAVFAEGKERPLAIGKLTMSTADIRKKNKGNVIEVLHYLGDGLWKYEA